MSANGALPPIDWIDKHPWIQAIKTPVSEQTPAGSSIEDLEAFYELDEELMKRGTLQHGDIRWPWVVQEALALFEKSKDLRLLSALLLALPQQIQPENHSIPLSIALTAQYFILWGKTGFPKDKSRVRLIKHISDRLLESFQKTGGTFENDALRSVILDRANQCQAVIEELLPDASHAFQSIIHQLETYPIAENSTQPTASGSIHGGPQSKVASPTQSPLSALLPESPPLPEFGIDGTNERALKQGLVSVADFLLKNNPDHAISYQLRRYATWFGVNALPPIRSEQKTVLQAVSNETIDRYRTAVDKTQTDHDMVSKLERTCHLQPFWLEGQLLAFQLAQRAGRPAVMDAILHSTQQFVHNIPGLKNLSFSDGTPFITNDVRDWLEPQPELNSVDETEVAVTIEALKEGENEPLLEEITTPLSNEKTIEKTQPQYIVVDRRFQNVYKSIQKLVTKGDYPKALSLLDQERKKAENPRIAMLWEISTLEILKELGMGTHASAQALRLWKDLTTIPLLEWEPEIFNRLRSLI